MSEIVILDSDRGKTFEGRVGDLIAIRLAENPTTGYRWDVSEGDDRLVEFQGSDYSVSSEARVGGGGIRVFHWRAKGMGTAQIRLNLRRAWESEARSVEQFTVSIRIQ